MRTGLQVSYLSIPQHNRYVSMANLLSKFQNVFKVLIFVIPNVKRKWKIRHSINFLTQQKEPLNKQNSLTRYYSTNLRLLEGFLATTTTKQGVRFHQYIIK